MRSTVGSKPEPEMNEGSAATSTASCAARQPGHTARIAVARAAHDAALGAMRSELARVGMLTSVRTEHATSSGAGERSAVASDAAGHRLSRRQFCLSLVALATSAGWIAQEPSRSVAMQGRGHATQRTSAGRNVMVDEATADLRRRLRSRPELDWLAESVSFEGAETLSTLTLFDEPGAVRITPRA